MLNEEYQIHGVGSQTKDGKLSLYMSFSGQKVVCSKRDFTLYLNMWEKWPTIVH